ncbi:MAG: peptide deformylase [Clostridia bacterium]|nr:peptide deformylase [Clostridia bacterium]
MALRNIIVEGDDLLRERSREVTVFDDRLSLLIDDMVETMFDADGVGLAAPQISILKRVCVVCTDGQKIYELINPEVLESSGEQEGYEGCLSVPGARGLVKRPTYLKVKSKDRKGNDVIFEVRDFEAVAFCHEMDHLDGILFIDKMERQ